MNNSLCKQPVHLLCSSLLCESAHSRPGTPSHTHCSPSPRCHCPFTLLLTKPTKLEGFNGNHSFPRTGAADALNYLLTPSRTTASYTHTERGVYHTKTHICIRGSMMCCWVNRSFSNHCQVSVLLQNSFSRGYEVCRETLTDRRHCNSLVCHISLLLSRTLVLNVTA